MAAVQRILAHIVALPGRVKLMLAVGLVLGAAALAGGLSVTRDARVALFATPLYPEQATEVQTRLAAWGIPFAPLADNVRVDPRKRADLLLRLALAGVPHRHLATSDEAFAHVNALTPQSILEAQTRDALASDLAQGLRGLDGVADARVIVAPATSGAYADEAAHDASASVRITLAPGAHLAPPAIAAIRAFVAGGVPGLAADRVIVLDDRGALDGGTAVADDDSVQTSLQSALDAALGAGATIVRVHREPTGEARDVHDIKRAPLAGDLTRTSGDEHYASAQKKYQKATATEEHGSETHDVHRVAGADATARLSVAIFVDGSRAIDLDKIRELASAAAGIDERRGDTLRVEAVRFAGQTTPIVRGVDAWAIAGLFAGTLPQLALVAGAIVLAVLGARPAYAVIVRAVEAVSVRTASRESAGLPPARVRGALVGEPPHVAAAVISALPAATATAVLELYPPEERAQIVRRLSRAATDLVPHAEELLRARG
jgi:flagellar M-ring protein FliF